MDNYPGYYRPSRTGDVPPIYDYRPGTAVPSVQEQMGIDPQSKLAAAINRLCDLLEGNRD